MTIHRLRPKHSDAEISRIYGKLHDSKQFHDHDIRVAITADVAHWLLPPSTATIADLSAGDGAITRVLKQRRQGDYYYLGDYAPGYAFQGPIEETIEEVHGVDLFICAETLEHVDEPLKLLKAIRRISNMLVLSTPIDEPLNSGNVEHYWSWSVSDIGDLLAQAGWKREVLVPIMLNTYYSFQVWGCK